MRGDVNHAQPRAHSKFRWCRSSNETVDDDHVDRSSAPTGGDTWRDGERMIRHYIGLPALVPPRAAGTALKYDQACQWSRHWPLGEVSRRIKH